MQKNNIVSKLEKSNIYILSLLLVFLLGSFIIPLWGFEPHQKINKTAILLLPDKLIGFYKKNSDYISTHSTDPDKRSIKDKFEPSKHFINLEKYKNIPRNLDSLNKLFPKDSLNKFGILPWWIELMTNQLTKAFKNKDEKEILYLSANIGHYIADACVPLHSTMYYNGKKPAQKGIHSLFETRVPQISSESYDFFVGKAEYISNPYKKAWELVYESNKEVDSILYAFDKLSSFPPDKKHAFKKNGKINKNVFSEEFAKEFEKGLDNMVERKMQRAVHMVSSFWYTAWVNAGQPDLTKIADNIKSN